MIAAAPETVRNRIRLIASGAPPSFRGAAGVRPSRGVEVVFFNRSGRRGSSPHKKGKRQKQAAGGREKFREVGLKMAKYAILSDIHANGDALDVVLEKCRELEITHYVSLGDIVGYNAEPRQCLYRVRDLNWVAMVRGNHDEYTAHGNPEQSGFNPHAKAAITWTREQLDESEREWLVSMPFRTTIPGLNSTIVHATLDSPENWGYIFDVHHAADNFAYQFTQICYCGHSHVPVAFHKKPITAVNERSIEEIPAWVYNEKLGDNNFDFTQPDSLTVEVQVGFKYLFNVGSIGQPRNHDPRASFAVLDTEERTITRYRLPYDIASQQNKIIDAGLPERLALRLASGS